MATFAGDVARMSSDDLDDAFLLEVSQQEEDGFDAKKLKQIQEEMSARMARKKPLKRKPLAYVLSKIAYDCYCLMYVWQCRDVCLSKPYLCDVVCSKVLHSMCRSRPFT